MRYIKSINELTSDVYNRASHRLDSLGHKNRSTILAHYGNDVKIKEVDAEQAKAITNYEDSYRECKEKLEGKRPFKLNIPEFETFSRNTGGFKSAKKEKITLFDDSTEFYFHGIYCDEQDMEWQDFISHSESNISFKFVIMFSYIHKDISREYKQGMHPEISKAYIDYIDAFSIIVDTHMDLDTINSYYYNMNSSSAEEDMLRNTNLYTTTAYCHQIGNEIKLSLNNRSDARFILDKLKQQMTDNGFIFKGLYNKFKKQDVDFDYHLVLTTLQRAINDKVTLNMLYRDSL